MTPPSRVQVAPPQRRLVDAARSGEALVVNHLFSSAALALTAAGAHNEARQLLIELTERPEVDVFDDPQLGNVR